MLDPKERVKRIRMLEREIERFKRKYGMNLEEFFELTESNIGKLLERGFDLDEILRDVSIWEDLEDELRELRSKDEGDRSTD